MTTFRARARAIDMLGRQQIRGVGTALSELFKNAHDAYATEARADFFRDRNTLVVRDDGIGMSPNDFEERWLTLGTDSKVSGGLGIPKPPKNMKRRQLLGEKGIGRLAVAAIGAQTLILTKAREGGLPIVAAFINWDLFELPAINLGEVNIPVAQIEPNVGLVDALGELIESGVKSIAELRMPAKRRTEIAAAMRAFPIDLVDLTDKLDGPRIRAGGTHFYIAPVDDALIAELARDDADSTPELVQTLIGFANTLEGTPAMSTSFVDRPQPGSDRDLLARGDFWTREDLADADHEVEGAFDVYGRFTGQVRVYDKISEHHFLRKGGLGVTGAGPFSIHFGYLQGDPRSSRADPDRQAALAKKARQLAGLYVYRHGVRVQPYGDSRFDWLDIELRRSKGASYYFFSYRRMFGYISIQGRPESGLVEKAGREGFRENAAYRAFRQTLKEFLADVVATFFRGEGEAYFRQRQSEIEREFVARTEREKAADRARAAFQKNLADRQRRLERGTPTRELETTMRRFERAIDKGTTRSAISAAALTALAGLDSIRLRGVLDEPGDVGLTNQLRQDAVAYRTEWLRTQSLLDEAKKDVERDSTAAIGRLPPELITEAPPESLGTTFLVAARDRVLAGLDTEGVAVGVAITDLIRRMDDAQASFRSRVEAVPLDPSHRAEAETALTEAGRQADRLLRLLASDIEAVRLVEAEDGTLLASAELRGSADREIAELQLQLDRDLELAQLGLAIEVVSHEFRATIVTIRDGLDGLAAWGKRNPELAALHWNIATAFEHLDNYLTLFTPLQRRTQVAPTELEGDEIVRFLTDLFDDRTSADGITLEATPAFVEGTLVGRAAVFYPVFINLVDNATFWVRDHREPRVVRLDRGGDVLIVEDSGPGITEADRKAVFDPGFTRKPGGRGLGLYITRQVLERNGYSLTVRSSDLGGARFEITPIADGEGGDGVSATDLR